MCDQKSLEVHLKKYREGYVQKWNLRLKSIFKCPNTNDTSDLFPNEHRYIRARGDFAYNSFSIDFYFDLVDRWRSLQNAGTQILVFGHTEAWTHWLQCSKGSKLSRKRDQTYQHQFCVYRSVREYGQWQCFTQHCLCESCPILTNQDPVSPCLLKRSKAMIAY